MSPNTDFIPFARPSIGPEEETAVLAVLRSGWLTTGKVAKAFEEDFAAFVGAPLERNPFALAVNSATSGLHLALESLGIGPGDFIATSPYTFASTATVARHLGAEVAFCDITKEDYGIDPERLEALLDGEARIKAVVAVHVGGLPCRMAELLAITSRHGVALVEDAAHAFPSRIPAASLPGRGEAFAGTIGDIGVYSFYATKTITTGEGGMIVTARGDLAKRMATMRSHGFDRDAFDRYTSKTASWYYEVAEAGFKYNLPDLLAAIGREQLKKAGTFLAERQEIARRYDEAFAGNPLLELPPRGPGHAWHLYSLRLGGAIENGRDRFFELLQKKGVGASVHFIPLHLMPYFARRYGLSPADFPEAYGKYLRTISLPIWQGMSRAQIERVEEVVLESALELAQTGSSGSV